MEDSEKQRLKSLTNILKEYNRDMYTQFVDNYKQNDYEVDFYGEVKPFADKLLVVANEWKPLALQWVNAVHPKYVYHIQINDTYDNLTIGSVTAFQKDTRRKRFLEMIKSIEYVLEAIDEQI